MGNEYKNLHEQFVSNLTGTSAEEVLCISCITLLSSSVLSLGKEFFAKPSTGFVEEVQLGHTWHTNVLESSVLVPILLSTTVLSDFSLYTLLSLLVVMFIAKIFTQKFGYHKTLPQISGLRNDSDRGFHFLTNFRSHLLVDTALSILAVDFPVYPRRLAKTELYGWGYMDAGVGSFVVAAGLVARDTRENSLIPIRNKVRKELLSSLPILLIGIVRVVIVELINYQKHISEYGSHWNFFLTLGFTRIAGSLITSYIPTIPTAALSLLFMFLYQTSLNYGLTDYIVSDDRQSIISANKEGLISLFGYISLYLFAINLGKVIYRRTTGSNSQWSNVSLLLLLGISTHLLMYVAHYYIQNVSRRLVNLGYAFWMISLTSFQLAFHFIVIFVNGNDNRLFKAVNHNALFYFLLANLLTGVVNLTIPTISTNNSVALIILYLYLLTLSLIMLYLYHRDIVIKLPLMKQRQK